MKYFKICEKCGARLDPTEKCDCNDKKQKIKEALELPEFTDKLGGEEE